MYCAACGTQLAPGLSYCNRCGMNLKERREPKASSVAAYLTAITLIAIGGLGLMLGGALALRIGGDFHEDMVSIYMFMTFCLIALVEIFLCRQLSRLNRNSEKNQQPASPLAASMPELQPAQPRALAEPVASVTENTTRTLGYSHKEPVR